MVETDHSMVVVEIIIMTHHQMMNLATIIMDTLIVVRTIITTRISTITIIGTMGTIKGGFKMIIDQYIDALDSLAL